MSISLNSISKFKTRVLPSVIEFIKRKETLPERLLFSLASLIIFYSGKREDEAIALKDDQSVLDFFSKNWMAVNASELTVEDFVNTVLSNTDFWGEDLTAYDGLASLVSAYVSEIRVEGIGSALNKFNAK
jgi:tagaturonate reductase